MVSPSGFISSLILVLLLLIPIYLLYQSNIMYSQKILPNHTCINNGYYHNKICITCASRSNAQIFTDTSLVIKNSQTEFKTINIPKDNILGCEQIIQMMDYTQLDSYQSVHDLHFETNVPEISQLVELLAITTSNSDGKQARVQKSYQMVGMIELIDRNSEPKLNKLQYVPKDSQVLLEKYFRICSEACAVFLLVYLAYNLAQKRQSWWRILVYLSIVIMIVVACSDGVISEYKDFRTLKFGRCLLSGLILMKSGATRLLNIIFMVSLLFINEKYEFYLFMVGLALFILLVISKKEQQKIENKQIILVTLLLMLILCSWMKNQIKIQYILLSLILEFNLLVFGPILTELKDQPSGIKYEQLPDSGISLPGFEETINDQEQED